MQKITIDPLNTAIVAAAISRHTLTDSKHPADRSTGCFIARKTLTG
jgi:hypothetical protein